MQENVLIILLLLMIGTVAKVVYGAMHKIKSENLKYPNKVDCATHSNPFSGLESPPQSANNYIRRPEFRKLSDFQFLAHKPWFFPTK
jgi:hypothetical protein